MKKICVLVLLFVCAYAQRNPKNVLKNQYLKRTARQALLAAGTESCTALDCNNRGTCLGPKSAPVCVCLYGYAGSRCEDTHCDSNTACNGRGLCVGTASNFSCLCHYGYGGNRCEYVTTAGQPAPAAPAQQNVVYGQQPTYQGQQQGAYGPSYQQGYPQQGYQQG
uniref:EGF-like domain-containing protein n=1 Tax=Acrobeloides nanus TaxID=290746 RepID=A0A914EAJ9_9BILA